VPMLLASVASQSVRKVPWRSGWKARGRGMAAPCRAARRGGSAARRRARAAAQQNVLRRRNRACHLGEAMPALSSAGGGTP
jgi:hypothetical protein